MRMSKRETVELLLYDVALEHSAIVQYLYHIFLIGNKSLTEDIETIVRQEMRHLKWFAQKVVKLGGEVSLGRVEEAIQIGDSVESMLQNDVNAEEHAIKVYSQQLEVVKDDSVKKLLERVINDETQHREEFTELLEEAKSLREEEGRETEVDTETVELLNKLLQEEYRIIIDYLYQFFHSKDCEYKDIMLDLAVESMVHMGWLGEEIGSLGGTPKIDADLSPPKEVSLPERVSEGIAFEERSKETYLKEAQRIKNPKVKKLLEFIEKQEDYHKQKLLEFFRSMRRLTVGGIDGD